MMRLVALLCLLPFVSAGQLAYGEDGNGILNRKTGGVYFMYTPYFMEITSPEAQHRVAKKRAKERFEKFTDPVPTAHRVVASCNSSDFTGPNLLVEKIVVVAAGEPVQPLKLEVARREQQNSFGAKRIVQDAEAMFSPEPFREVDHPLTVAVVTSERRFDFEVLPADLRLLNEGSLR